MNHAPTPWGAFDTGIGWAITANHVRVVTISYEGKGADGYEEAKADAEFIARACNAHQALLDACGHAREVLALMPDGRGGISMFNLDPDGNRTGGAEVIRLNLADELEMAVAKARGKANV